MHEPGCSSFTVNSFTCGSVTNPPLCTYQCHISDSLSIASTYVEHLFIYDSSRKNKMNYIIVY